MAAVVIASKPMLRQDRRCVTFKDCYFADPASESPLNRGYIVAAQSPFAPSPAAHSPFGHADCQRAPRRAHTVSFNIPFAEAQMMALAQAANFGECSPGGFGGCSPAGFGGLPGGSPCHFPDTSPQTEAPMRAQRQTRRAKTVGAFPCSQVAVSVIAPGGGTGINASVYASLARKDGCSVDIVGQSRAAYDRYPASWANEGAPAPNLESFALDLIAHNRLANTDCLVVGSRGGQVVLPTLWQELGEDVPPAVVMNGGCAMGLPTPVHWPTNAVTFVLLGGQDYFRGRMSMHDYVADAKSRVPQENKSTAILLVHEMVHMPQAELLNAILMHMIQAVTSWKATERVPMDELDGILDNLRRGGWSGMLTFKSGSGDSWNIEKFP